jgi:hypothetical protein
MGGTQSRARGSGRASDILDTQRAAIDRARDLNPYDHPENECGILELVAATNGARDVDSGFVDFENLNVVADRRTLCQEDLDSEFAASVRDAR